MQWHSLFVSTSVFSVCIPESAAASVYTPAASRNHQVPHLKCFADRKEAPYHAFVTASARFGDVKIGFTDDDAEQVGVKLQLRILGIPLASVRSMRVPRGICFENEARRSRNSLCTSGKSEDQTISCGRFQKRQF